MYLIKEVGHTFVVMVCILPILTVYGIILGLLFLMPSDTTIVRHGNIFLENVFSLKVACTS